MALLRPNTTFEFLFQFREGALGGPPCSGEQLAQHRATRWSCTWCFCIEEELFSCVSGEGRS